MSSSPESPHLDNHHRNTLRQIFEHPVSHNIEWPATPPPEPHVPPGRPTNKIVDLYCPDRGGSDPR